MGNNHENNNLMMMMIPFLTILSFILTTFIIQPKVTGEDDSLIWSIPENNDFYNNWSNNHSFRIGDTLVFEFESDGGLYNVMQVSRREYDSCSCENPFREFLVGPASITFVQDGVFYFICSVANYCNLGLKLSVSVYHHPQQTGSPPPLPPHPLPT